LTQIKVLEPSLIKPGHKVHGALAKFLGFATMKQFNLAPKRKVNQDV
jgi:hypothetical protein